MSDPKDNNASQRKTRVSDFILLADDTNIFFSHKDINILSETLNSELGTLTQCCNANKLSINFKKSNFMIFMPRQKNNNKGLTCQSI